MIIDAFYYAILTFGIIINTIKYSHICKKIDQLF